MPLVPASRCAVTLLFYDFAYVAPSWWFFALAYLPPMNMKRICKDEHHHEITSLFPNTTLLK